MKIYQLFRARSPQLSMGDGNDMIEWICSERSSTLPYEDLIDGYEYLEEPIQDLATQFVNEMFTKEEIQHLRAYLMTKSFTLETTEVILPISSFSSDVDGNYSAEQSWSSGMGKPQFVLDQMYDDYNLLFWVKGYIVPPSSEA